MTRYNQTIFQMVTDSVRTIALVGASLINNGAHAAGIERKRTALLPRHVALYGAFGSPKKSPNSRATRCSAQGRQRTQVDTF